MRRGSSKPNLFARGCPCESADVGKIFSQSAVVTLAVQNHYSSETVPANGVVDECDGIAVGRNAKGTDPALRDKELMTLRVLHDEISASQGGERERLAVGRPVGACCPFIQFARRTAGQRHAGQGS